MTSSNIFDIENLPLSPEIKLLFLCLSVKQDRETLRQIEELLQFNLNWESLLKTAIGQGVAPLLYHNLQRSGIKITCHDFIEQLKKSYFHTGGRNTLYRAGLKEILEAFREASIEVIVLKGAALNESVYPNPAIRSMTDIDLLVKENRIQIACDTLQQIGYIQRAPMSLEAQQKEFHALRYPFEKPQRPLVDLHWTIEASHKSVSVEPKDIWDRAIPSTVTGAPALLLCPEDLLLHLCLHLSYHHKFAVAGIRSLCDIAQTVQRYETELDWQQLAQTAFAWRMRNSTYLTLLLAKVLLHASVPDDVLAGLKAKDFSNSLVYGALERLLLGQWKHEQALSYNVLAELWAADHFRGRVGILIRRAIISPEAIAARYPVSSDSKRVYLWYPVWFMQEGARFGKYLWRMLRGDKRVETFIKLNDWLESG